MAGTLVITTLSDGTNSTSATNCIQGSAKAWVNWNGSTGTIRASYNVTSITKIATGNYGINFTNAFADVNYCAVGMTGNTSSFGKIIEFYGAQAAPTTTVLTVCTSNGASLLDDVYNSVSVFR